MPVQIQNEAALRQANRWNERDDAALAVMLRKKIKEVDLAVKEASTPYERARLKERKKHYKSMYRKVASGNYNSDIIASDMGAAAAAAGYAPNYNGVRGGYGKITAGKYRNSYEDMDFDYQTYFRKTRYFGISLPLIMTVLTIVFLAVFILGAVLPVSLKNTIYESTGLSADAMFTFRLGEGDDDFQIKNDGNWPDGTWKYSGGKEVILEHGVPYSVDNTTPATVSLYTDLGMRTINISAFDIVKAWFRTPMLEKTRIDFLEDNENFMGPSWFFSKFLDGKELKIAKGSDGKYTFSSFFTVVGAYGTIFCLILGFVFGLVALIVNIVRIFTYTTRKVHWLNVLAFIFTLFAALLPVLLIVQGTDFAAALTGSYFLFDDVALRGSTTASLMVNFVAFIPAAVMLICMFLPLLFRNRARKKPTYIPKGNKKYRTGY